MTPLQRAEAYEAEAAQMIDRTIRKLPEGVETDASRKLVDLIVQSAVARMTDTLTAVLDNAASHQAKTMKSVARCSKTWSIGRGDHGERLTGTCILTLGHEGKCQLQSASGIPYVMPGEIDNEPNPETWRFQATCTAAFRCTLAPGHDGMHKFDSE
jgi:hypothetical protein